MKKVVFTMEAFTSASCVKRIESFAAKIPARNIIDLDALLLVEESPKGC